MCCWHTQRRCSEQLLTETLISCQATVFAYSNAVSLQTVFHVICVQVLQLGINHNACL